MMMMMMMMMMRKFYESDQAMHESERRIGSRIRSHLSAGQISQIRGSDPGVTAGFQVWDLVDRFQDLGSSFQGQGGGFEISGFWLTRCLGFGVEGFRVECLGF